MTDKLQEIREQVSQEWGHTNWSDFKESLKHRLGSAHAEIDDVMQEIARRYATLIAENIRAKCAENVDKQSILETKIELI